MTTEQRPEAGGSQDDPEPDRPADQEQPGREVGVLTLVVFMLSIIALGFEFWYLSSRREFVGIDVLALVAAVPRGRDALRNKLVVALAVVVIVMGCICAAVWWSGNQPKQVDPQLYWPGPLDIGKQGAFTFDTHGYAKAKIKFALDEAEPNGALCVPSTRVDLSMGPPNNPQPLPEIDPSNLEITVNLSDDSSKATIFATITNTQPQQIICPVMLRIPSVILMKD